MKPAAWGFAQGKKTYVRMSVSKTPCRDSKLRLMNHLHAGERLLRALIFLGQQIMATRSSLETTGNVVRNFDWARIPRGLDLSAVARVVNYLTGILEASESASRRYAYRANGV